MIIKQRHLDRIMAEQRAMFPLEQLLVDAPCALTPFQCPQCPNCDLSTYHVSNRIVVIEPCKWKADYFPVSALGMREMNTYNPCNFFCEDCDMPVTIHRYGRPFIDGRGYVVRRCLNDGTNRAHTKDDYERCTDKHVLLKRDQLERGINRFRSQMSDPDAQLVRERERQERRLTTNERPSEFDSTLVRIDSTQRAPRPMTDFTARLQRDGLITSEGG